jgi:hypothetical protein
MSKVAWNYIVPVVLPKDLKGIEPGKLPANLLKAVPGGGKMHWIAACAWTAMVEKAKAEGVVLKPTSSGDTYREYEFQKRGFLSRYQLQPIPGQSTKTFEGKKWYLKKGMAMLATPGKSNHNLGLAVDVHSASEPKRINWLIANVKEFGFSWEVVPSEPWHIRYVCGDNIPASVKAWMDANGVTAPAAGVPAPTPAKPATPAGVGLHWKFNGAEWVATKNKPAKPAPAASISDDLKVKIQEALKARGFYTGNIDGDLGPKSRAAIKAFKVKNGLPADGVPGPKVLELLGLK